LIIAKSPFFGGNCGNHRHQQPIIVLSLSFAHLLVQYPKKDVPESAFAPGFGMSSASDHAIEIGHQIEIGTSYFAMFFFFE